MTIDKKVGYMSVSCLQGFVKESIGLSYFSKDYAHLVSYIALYKQYEAYLNNKEEEREGDVSIN